MCNQVYAGCEVRGQYMIIHSALCATRCLQDVRSGVGKLLNYVNSVKRLADIRDAVWDIVAQVCTFELCYI